MQKTLGQLRSLPAISTLHIQAFEMGLYLAQVDIDDKRYLLGDEQGKPLHFRSIEQVRNALEDLNIKRAQLEHQSPYDEMVGCQDDGCSLMVMPLPWPVIGYNDSDMA